MEKEFLSSILHVTIISPFVEYLIDVCSFVVRLIVYMYLVSLSAWAQKDGFDWVRVCNWMHLFLGLFFLWGYIAY